MRSAPEFHQISPDCFLWHSYDPASKAELFSTALVCSRQLWLVDPIPIAEESLAELIAVAYLQGVVVTNANHHRSAVEFSRRFSVPLHAHTDTFPDEVPPSFVPLADGAQLTETLQAIAIEGAAPGEIALLSTSGHGSIVMGDALINFEPYGFTFLPAKYCENERQMRHSLRRLLELSFGRLFFAHGTPILANARSRLKSLIESEGA